MGIVQKSRTTILGLWGRFSGWVMGVFRFVVVLKVVGMEYLGGGRVGWR